jgi:hypothetical protein
MLQRCLVQIFEYVVLRLSDKRRVLAGHEMSDADALEPRVSP